MSLGTGPKTYSLTVLFLGRRIDFGVYCSAIASSGSGKYCGRRNGFKGPVILESERKHWSWKKQGDLTYISRLEFIGMNCYLNIFESQKKADKMRGEVFDLSSMRNDATSRVLGIAE